MNFLQKIVFQSLLNHHDESYAREVADRVKSPLSLWNLDDRNLNSVAAELRCTRAELDAFMLVDRAIRNANPCR